MSWIDFFFNIGLASHVLDFPYFSYFSFFSFKQKSSKGEETRATVVNETLRTVRVHPVLAHPARRPEGLRYGHLDCPGFGTHVMDWLDGIFSTSGSASHVLNFPYFSFFSFKQILKRKGEIGQIGGFGIDVMDWLDGISSTSGWRAMSWISPISPSKKIGRQKKEKTEGFGDHCESKMALLRLTRETTPLNYDSWKRGLRRGGG